MKGEISESMEEHLLWFILLVSTVAGFWLVCSLDKILDRIRTRPGRRRRPLHEEPPAPWDDAPTA